MDYWLLWRNLFFGKIKIRSRYLNFAAEILITAETYFLSALYFDLIVTDLQAERKRLGSHRLIIFLFFACNAKSFAIVILFFSFDQDLTYFIGHIKKSLCN